MICLEEWEMLCDKCNGLRYSRENGIRGIRCPECQGTGKVDWLENILGKAPMKGSDTSEWLPPAGFDRGVHDDAIDAMAQQLANEIDKEILESILESAEQTNKIMNIAKTIMCEMEGKT